MKKNKMMRIASVLLVAVLLSTCAISGTFAKYVQEGTSTDTSRVAKWGVTVGATSNSAFKKTYTVSESDARAIVNADVDIGDDYLVAPGTAGEITDVDLDGKPEVAVEVIYAAEVKLGDGDNLWKIGETEYFPIIITVGTTTYGMKTVDNEGADVTTTGADETFTTIADLEDAIEEAIVAYGKQYPVNTDLSSEETPSVSWSWTFVAENGNTYQTNDKDAALGNLENLPSISISITTTVQQINEFDAPAQNDEPDVQVPSEQVPAEGQ